MSVRMLVGDALERLRELPDNSVHCVVTSPPYYGLRMYLQEGHPDKAHEIGLEDTPAAYVARLVEVFCEVRRVLRDDGVVWLNIGDSYTSGGRDGHGTRVGYKQQTNRGMNGTNDPRRPPQPPGLKPKDLMGIPWRVAFALQDDGWYLRSDCIWAKKNSMPESVTDRPTKSHEYVFMLTKSGETTFWAHRDKPGTRMRPEPDYRWVHKKTGEEIDRDPGDPERWKRINLWSGRDYFFDQEAVREPHKPESLARYEYGFKATADPNAIKGSLADRRQAGIGNSERMGDFMNLAGRNIRSVWNIATEPCDLAHFATMPSELARRCILAGSSARGCCPACGAPHVRVVERASTAARSHDWRDRWPSTTPGHNTIQRAGVVVSTSTTGWRQSCSCPPADPIPAVILDPFAGAGTTGLAAEQLGRDAILIELSPEYARMAEERLARAKARRFIGDADRATPLPGQADLFGAEFSEG